MPHHFENAPKQNATSAYNSAPASAELTGTLAADPVFTALSPNGQKTVRDYLTHIEKGLAGGFVGPGSFAFEPVETLRELQSHLLSLISAFQEIGDDEPKAIASALAQFGAARTVSRGLQRAKSWQHVGISPTLVIPLIIFGLALLMPVVMELWYLPFLRIPGPLGWPPTAGHTSPDHIGLFVGLFGWPGLFLLPFAAGVFGASQKEKSVNTNLFLGMILVVGTASLMSFAFTENIITSPAIFSEIRHFVVQASSFWVLSVLLGMGFVRGVRAFRRRKESK